MKFSIGAMLLKLFGWTMIGAEQARTLKKFVLIAGPHTSAWDFPLGLAIRSAADLDTKYLGKASLFRPPFGLIFRFLGGYPVDRSKRHNLVEAVVDIFNTKEEFSIALSPEGTRKRVDKFKTGFYYIARGAKVPIIVVTFDFKQKLITFYPPYYTTEDESVDMKFFESKFRGVVGKIPEKSFF